MSERERPSPLPFSAARGRPRGGAEGGGVGGVRGEGAGMGEFFARLAGVVGVDPVPVDPAGSVLADAVGAVAAAAAAAAGRWPGMITVPGWELAAVLTLGSLLSPSVFFARVRDDAPLPALT